MSKKKDLVKNTLIILFGKVSTQLISFLMLPLYTSYLLTSEYGLVDLVITYVSLLAPVVILQLDQSIFRFLIDVRDNENKKVKLISSGIVLMFKTVASFTGLFLLISLFINIPFAWYIYGVIVSGILLSTLMQISRGFGNNLVYTIGNVIVGLLTVILNIIFIVVLRLGASGMLLSMIISYLVGVLYLVFSIKIFKYIKLNEADKKLGNELLKYSLPLIPNGVSWWIVNVSDRTIITYFLGVAENGIYAISNKFSAIINMLLGVFSISWTESAALHIESKDRDVFFTDIFNTVVKLFTTVTITLIASMPVLFILLINDSYHDAYNYVPILLMATLFNTFITLYSGIYVAKKLTKKVATTSLLAAVINIILNLLFINTLGLYAASLSTLISYGSMMIYRYYDIKKYVKIKYDYKTIVILLLFLGIITYLYYFNSLIISILSVVVSLVVMIILNKDIILKILKKGKIV